jgi:putative sigma-54 modulation protein
VRTIVKGKNLAVPDPDRRYVEQKMHRLERLLDDRTDAVVELSLERRKSAEDSHIVEVTLVIDGRTLRGVARGATFHEAADIVTDKLERRAVDHKEKPQRRSRPVEEKQLLRSIADGTPDETTRGPNIVKVKRFAIEPMFEEDAVAQMEELGHSFFVFVNAENEHVAVLYRRDDGDYGLIEPSIGGGYTSGSNGSGPKGSARRRG